MLWLAQHHSKYIGAMPNQSRRTDALAWLLLLCLGWEEAIALAWQRAGVIIDSKK